MDDQSTPSNALPASPLRPEIVRETRRKPGLFGRLVKAMIVVGLLGSIALNLVLFVVVGLLGAGLSEDGRVREKFVAGNRHGDEKVAIFSIEGMIVSGEGFFKQQLDHAKKDIEEGNLKAIVVRVNSPGGTVTGSDYMLHQLKKLTAGERRIPIVVSMGDIAASGGYYVSMCVGDAEDAIFAEPTTTTGSIGVLFPHYNLGELMEKWGIADDTVASNPLKTMGSLARKMTAKEREIFQALVDDNFNRFKDVIKQGRPRFRREPAALDKLATGQVFTANQAMANGLVDRIGFVEDAVDRAIRLARLDKKNVKVVKYKAEPTLSEAIFGRGQAQQQSVNLSAILDAATPRAYYLYTWLPGLTNSPR
ncbi:MAG: signal peptide peptidase SppA [Planctomycetaceae bacterium]|nr:signal peptide peptidase SppA [Planctomycetaceae bacterium]